MLCVQRSRFLIGPCALHFMTRNDRNVPRPKSGGCSVLICESGAHIPQHVKPCNTIILTNWVMIHGNGQLIP
jgi:hypothetical protein